MSLGARVWQKVTPIRVFYGLLGLFLLARVVIWIGGDVLVAFDSGSYGAGPTRRASGSTLSFFGSSPRLWGTPLLYAITGTDSVRVFAQWLIGTAAWGLLAYALWTCLRTMAVRLVAVALALGLGLTKTVANWDFALLSESLSISLGVLTLALFLLWGTTKRRVFLIGMVATGVWWTFTRPEIQLFVAVLAVALLVWAWRDQAHRRAALVAGVVLVAGVGWCLAITPRVTDTFASWSTTGLPLPEETFNYRLRLTVLPNPKIKQVYAEQLGMPPCAAADEVAAGSEWALAKFADAYRSCPELKAWGEENMTSSGYRYALAAPGDYVVNTSRLLPISLAGTSYANTPALLPGFVERIAFPPRTLVIFAIVGGIALSLIAALLTGGLRRRRLLGYTALTVAVVSFASVLAGLMLSAGEYSRFGIQEAVLTRVSVLILALAVIDSIVEARAGRRAEEPTPNTAEAELTPA